MCSTEGVDPSPGGIAIDLALLPTPSWTTPSLIAAFAVAATLIGLGGARMAALADRLADRTGMGEAVMGAVFLGISTSLPGITASVTAAIDGHPELSVSNAMGGIAVQTVFLAIADVFHRRANLEHAAASATNLLYAALLIVLLSIVVLAINGPAGLAVGHVHVATPLLVLIYLIGMRAARRSASAPMWHPRKTAFTVEDRPDAESHRHGLGALWIGFAAAAGLVMASGAVVARAAGLIADRTGISESIMGGLFTAVSTSLPELVTTVAAVRRGALTLAVSDIVGGNAFDVLFVCVADLFWLEGPIYQAAGARPAFLGALAMLLNAVLLLGLLQREKRGLMNIGFESAMILVLYAAGMTALVLGG